MKLMTVLHKFYW